MPVKATWHDHNRTILHMQFSGDWNWEEYYPVLSDAQTMVTQISHNYFVVMDFTHSARRLPPNLLTHFRKAAENAPDHRKGVVIVTKQLMLVRVLVNTISRVLSFNYAIKMVTTFDEAESIVTEELEKLPT